MSFRAARNAATAVAFCGVALDAKVERAQAAEDQEAVERAGYAAHRVLQEAEPLGDRGVARHGDSEDGVAVPGEVLRGRVEGDVGAQVERPLEGRRGERVVDDEQRPVGAVREAVANRRGPRRRCR